MEDEQRAAGLEHAGELHERCTLVAARLVYVLEHAQAHGGRKLGVGERKSDGFVARHVAKQRLSGEHGWGIIER